ncbi:MAG: hypothetical protein ACJAU0_000197 [Flavobacteriales bacterium]
MAAAFIVNEICAANVIYKPTTKTNRDIQFIVPSRVSLYAAFSGGEANTSERDWKIHASVLSGAIGSLIDVTVNSKKIVLISNTTDDIVISRFEIQRFYNEVRSNFSFLSVSSIKFRQCESRNNC